MTYTAEQAANLEEQAQFRIGDLQTLRLRLLQETEPSLRVDRAKEYLKYGVARRIKTIERCIENVFTHFPVTTTRPLPLATLEDVAINVQTHAIHVTGILDNWAHVLTTELGIDIKPMQVGLFKEATQQVLPARLSDYLRDPKISAWHQKYAKDYRDSLAHRIPLYVPPALMTEDDHRAFNEADRNLLEAIKRRDHVEIDRLEKEKDNIGKPAFFVVHAFGDAAPIRFHPQMLADAMTISELSEHCMAEIPLN